MFVAAVDEAVDVNISIGDIEIVPSADVEQNPDRLQTVAFELNKIVVDNSYFKELQKERIKALVTIAR